MKPEIIYIPVNYRSCRLNLIAVSVLFAVMLAWSYWTPWVNGFVMYLFGVWVCRFLDFWTVWAKRDEDWEAAQAKLRDVCRNEVFQVERREDQVIRIGVDPQGKPLWGQRGNGEAHPLSTEGKGCLLRNGGRSGWRMPDH